MFINKNKYFSFHFKFTFKFEAKLDGILLEAPFLNASQGGKDYIISHIFNNNKWIQQMIDEGLEKSNIFFNTDKK